MKLGSVILCQKFYLRDNKIFDDVMTLASLMMSSCIFGSGSGRKFKLLCFSSNLLEIWYRGEFSDANYKNKPRLKMDNYLSLKKICFSADFSQKMYQTLKLK